MMKYKMCSVSMCEPAKKKKKKNEIQMGEINLYLMDNRFR